MKNSNFVHFYHLLKRRPHYRRLVLGGVVSQLGDWLSYIALSYVAVRAGGDQGALGAGLAISGVYLAHSLPNAIAAPFVGPIVDRVSRRTLILTSYVSACLLTLAIWSQVESGSLLLIQGLLFLRVIMSNVGMTARQAALPSLVTADELYTANALNSSVWSTLFTIGVSLGGVISAFFGPQEAILIDASTYLVSFALVWSLPTLSPQDPAGLYATEDSSSSRSSKGETPQPAQRSLDHPKSEGSKDDEDLKAHPLKQSATEEPDQSYHLIDAWRYAISRPIMWIPLFAKSPIAFFNGSGWIALNLIAVERNPELSAMLIGLFTAARGVGMGVGPAILSAKRVANPVYAQWLTLGALFGFVTADELWLQVMMLFVWGLGNGINWVSSTASLQSHTPTHLLGRMTSLDFLCFTVCQSIATLSAGWFFDQGNSIIMMTISVSSVGIIGLSILSFVDWRVRRQGL